MDTRTIEIDEYVNEINPARLGCSHRGVVELTLKDRDAVQDYCHESTVTAPTYVTNKVDNALDDRNNKCYSFKTKRESSSDPYFCYNSTTVKKSDATPSNKGTIPNNVEITDSDNTVTGCKKYTYVAQVTQDQPNGFIFSHISQDGAHYRMNFPGYKK